MKALKNGRTFSNPQTESVEYFPILKIKVSDIFQPSKLKCLTNDIRPINDPACRTKYGSPFLVSNYDTL